MKRGRKRMKMKATSQEPLRLTWPPTLRYKSWLTDTWWDAAVSWSTLPVLERK